MLARLARHVYTGWHDLTRCMVTPENAAATRHKSWTHRLTLLMRCGQSACGQLLTALIGAENTRESEGSMISVQLFRLSQLPAELAHTIAMQLTRPGSETARLLLDHANERLSDYAEDPLYAVCLAMSEEYDEPEPIAWVSLSQWDGKPALQAYTHEKYRQRHLASSLAGLVFATRLIPGDEICTFHPICTVIASRLGFARVIEYAMTQDGWKKLDEQG